MLRVVLAYRNVLIVVSKCTAEGDTVKSIAVCAFPPNDSYLFKAITYGKVRKNVLKVSRMSIE